VRDQLADANKLLGCELQLHVSGVCLELVEQLLGRRSKYVVDLGYLISFVFSWKQWEQRQHLEEYAADSPDVHLVAIVSVCH